MLNISQSTTFLLHNIGHYNNSNYNTWREVKEAKGILTFDGVYRNVYDNKDLLKDKKVILFIMGDYVGKDNSFDKKMPLEYICDWNEIMELVYDGAELGWHTWSHRDLRKLSDQELIKEVLPPFPMKYFAYPYGRVDKRVESVVKSLGYEAAFCAGKYGDGSQFQLKRPYLKI